MQAPRLCRAGAFGSLAVRPHRHFPPRCSLGHEDSRRTPVLQVRAVRHAATMAKPVGGESQKKREAAVPRPSSSVLLVSPDNRVLLLHRVQTSSSFPSAHVFPGGNCDAFHDGAIPAVDSAERHRDGPAYRMAAVRETFEESGILLAYNNGFGRLVEVAEREREDGRRLVHSGKVEFARWLSGKGGRADLEGLIPFTRWVTPANIPKRYTTQMYLYFLPLSNSGVASGETSTGIPTHNDALIPIPTPDGGVEHTAARFLHAADWIAKARSGEIILFPPQLFLLHLVATHLEAPRNSASSDASATHAHDELAAQRQSLRRFARTSDPPWGEKCISPTQLLRLKAPDGRAVLALDKPGLELEGGDRRGDSEHVVLVKFSKEGPRDVEVRLRSDILKEEREKL